MNRWKFSITILSFLLVNSIWSEDVCTSTECIQYAARLLERINDSVNPCDNFYDFACGKFIQENYTPDESVAVDTFTKLKDEIDTKVYKMMRSDVDDGNMNLKFSQKFFKKCLNRNQNSSIEEINFLKAIIQEVGGWPLLSGLLWDDSKWSLSETIMKIRETLGQRTDKVFDIASFIINLENANNPSLRPSATFFSLRSAYFNYISNLLNFLGATDGSPEMENELNHLLDFEYKLNLINHEPRQLSYSADIESNETLKNIFYFRWLNYFVPSQMKYVQDVESDEEKVPSILEGLETLLNKTSSRTLANFVALRLVDFVAAQSRSELGAIYVRFQRQIDGRQDREQIWKECVEKLTENLPFAISAAYIENHFKANVKTAAEEMYRNIKDKFAATIIEAEWIDESTRDKLLNKLQSLIPLIAYPDEGFDEHAINEFYDEIKIDKDHYLKTLFQLRVIAADEKFRQAFASSSTSTWKKYLAPTSIDAEYSPSDNTIKFSAGILQNLLLEQKVNYLGFGSTGFIIANGISHIVNQIINDAEALPEKVQNEFTTKTQCLIEQYGQYREQGLSQSLSGKRTAIENIADNTGLNLAYRAYKTWSEKFTGKRLNLIGLEYTWDKLFWLSAAQTWCGVYRREELIRKTSTDRHATERFRVIGPLANSPDFARDFNCSQLSLMNRKNKCIIW